MHAQSLSLVQLFCKHIDYSPLGSSAHGISQQEYRSGLLFSSPGDLPNLCIFCLLHWQVGSLPLRNQEAPTYPMEGHMRGWVRGLSRDQVSDWKTDFGRGLRVHSQPSDYITEVKATPAPVCLKQILWLAVGTVRFSCLLRLALRFQFFFRLSLEPDSESGDPREPICWTCATERKHGLSASVC